MYSVFKKTLCIAGLFLGLWLAVRFFLPLSFPFLLGCALALAAEPMVGFLTKRLKLRRGAAAAIGVTGVFCLLVLVLLTLLALIFRELALLVSLLPDLQAMADQSMTILSQWALSLTDRLPESLRRIVSPGISNFFSGSSQLLGQAFRYAMGLTGKFLTRVPGSAFVLATAIISSYMISAKLPRIRNWLSSRLSREWVRKFLEGLKRLRRALFSWLTAQAKLMGITWLILTMGLILLRIPYAPLWATAVALVDAFPILGTGTVLLPWALVCFLQADNARAIGLLGIYALISLSRSVLEPKLLGRHLGLDPLATLAALYVGFRLWGFGGMILSPILAVAAAQLLQNSTPEP